MYIYIYLDQPLPSNLRDLAKNQVLKPKTRFCDFDGDCQCCECILICIGPVASLFFHQPGAHVSPMQPGCPVQAWSLLKCKRL